METGATVTSPVEALARTDRALRRVLRNIREAELGVGEAFELEIRRARRQMRANKMLLDQARDPTAD